MNALNKNCKSGRCSREGVCSLPGPRNGDLLDNLPSSSPDFTAAHTRKPINCLYTNATSLNSVKKLADLQIRSAKGIDMVFVSETWFDVDSTTKMDSYKSFRRDRGKHEGGVIIYVKNTVESSEISNNDLRRILCPDTGNVEQVSCELFRSSSDDKLLLGCFYRPPLNCRSAEEIAKHAKTAADINKSIATAAKAVEAGIYKCLCVAGDFNFPDLQWSENMVMNRGKQDGLAGAFLDTLDSLSLHQAVRSPTFFRANGTATNVLDMIICERSERVDVTSITAPLGTSSQGHAVIEFCLNLNSPRRVAKFTSSNYSYSKGDYSSMRNELNSINWDTELNKDDVNASYERFLAIYNRLCDKFIPKFKSKSLNGRPVWMSSDLVRLDKKKQHLFHLNAKTNWKNQQKVREYRRVAQELRCKTKAAMTSFERRLAFDKNPKKLFSYVRRRNQVDTNISALKTKTNETVAAPRVMAEVLNNQFASVYQNETGELPTLSTPTAATPNLLNIAFLETDITGRLAKLDPNKSMGLDHVHPHVLRACADSFARPLALIFKSSLRLSCLPKIWRMAKVTPIFKKGSRLDPSNYRPISLTSVVCKIMESIVRDAIMTHLTSNNLISPQQHGFVPKRACNTNLLETRDFVTWCMQRKIPVDIIFIDLCKAFDKVPHRRLIQ